MTTVDQLLTKLIKFNIDDLKESMAYRDVRVLSSLNKSIIGSTFITENQGRLLLKILAENKNKLSEVVVDLADILKDPTWSRPFRPADTTKKMFIAKTNDDTPVIVVEFAYSSVIRKKISSLTKSLTGLSQTASGKQYQVDLTEKNIVALIDNLTEFNFDIDENLKNYYETIKSWDKTEVKNQFLFPSFSHETFKKCFAEDVNKENELSDLLVNDRKMRYQYFVEKTEKNPENLSESIAARTTSKIWANNQIISLESLFTSLNELKRFPVLLVFDSYNTKNCSEDLKKISEILEKIGITEDVGIYFRLDNTENGKEFNQLIKDKKYNSQLSSSTKVVGVQSGKIPKFLLKNEWKPMSVVSIGNNLRHSKTAVYANSCDLIISYTDIEPIYESKIAWE